MNYVFREDAQVSASANLGSELFIIFHQRLYHTHHNFNLAITTALICNRLSLALHRSTGGVVLSLPRLPSSSYAITWRSTKDQRRKTMGLAM